MDTNLIIAYSFVGIMVFFILIYSVIDLFNDMLNPIEDEEDYDENTN